MKKSNFKKEMILIISLLLLSIFSLPLYAEGGIITQPTCCLNPLESNAVCNSQYVARDACCQPFSERYDTNNIHGGKIPRDLSDCRTNFYDDSNNCQATTKSNACKVGFEICCC